MAITFQSTGIEFRLKQKKKLKLWLEALIHSEGKTTGRIAYLFSSDAYVLGLNQRFLNHNTYTDIITFHNNTGSQVSGDILISVERVEDNARRFGEDPETELKRVMAHGVLHLCGYKDKTEKDKKQMRAAENKALLFYDKIRIS
ncbi:MAG TPA: rRNA maturation RNase YbeY [Bacteroidia bacterium]|nr:rRNA maturation RNase YbeY [Bacteroidia bacterium]